jgi:hypothetical protein
MTENTFKVLDFIEKHSNDLVMTNCLDEEYFEVIFVREIFLEKIVYLLG